LLAINSLIAALEERYRFFNSPAASLNVPANAAAFSGA